MSAKKKLLVVAHAPSENTQRMVDAVLKGARHEDIENVEVTHIPPLQANAEDVLAADAIILGTTENLGYMSGALKDFFDRTYYAVLEKKQGLPAVAYIRAGQDGTGTKRALETILTGLKWRWVQEPLVCRGEFSEDFIAQCEELGLTMAASLDAGII
ncbi:flavodoxin family protein [Alkalimarinus alittae]|uniref:NAD(P)H-dependent oxidoreductase n=1 Tax=Alkalimarinus alittae TaxID=2961619 RepID=A0ABY6N2I5_9ALTE|nr:NAD(P)H-dependent oxidoreductase [Alkalimarinus alittae]UZE96327.1 NAD(P)H-dependent oxidoreductase [Alkalimarinus alittae]